MVWFQNDQPLEQAESHRVLPFRDKQHRDCVPRSRYLVNLRVVLNAPCASFDHPVSRSAAPRVIQMFSLLSLARAATVQNSNSNVDLAVMPQILANIQPRGWIK